MEGTQWASFFFFFLNAWANKWGNGRGRGLNTLPVVVLSQSRGIAPLTFAVTSPCPSPTPGTRTWNIYDCCTFFGSFPPLQHRHHCNTYTHRGMWKAFVDKTSDKRQLTLRGMSQYACKYLCTKPTRHHTLHSLKTNMACSVAKTVTGRR